MKDARPTKDMPAAGDLCCCRWVQTDWARGHFMAANAHLFHKVPVDQGIWISKVDCVVLFFRDNKLAVGL